MDEQEREKEEAEERAKARAALYAALSQKPEAKRALEGLEVTPEEIGDFIFDLSKNPLHFEEFARTLSPLAKLDTLTLSKAEKGQGEARLGLAETFNTLIMAFQVYVKLNSLTPEERKLLAEKNPSGAGDPIQFDPKDGRLLAWPLIQPILSAISSIVGVTEPLRPLTFAIPSHSLMFILLALFSGNPRMIPRRLLEKPYDDLTEPERKQIEAYSSNLKEGIFSTHDPETGEEEKRTRVTAIVSDNPKVNAELTLFREDVSFKEHALAVYIKKTFRVEGLKHLLGLLIGLEENYRKGSFEWEIHEHLARLGYKKNTGAYALAEKEASSILQILTSIFITATKKDGRREKEEGLKLFSIDGFKRESFDKKVIRERLLIRATDHWYRDSIAPPDKSSPKYTKLLTRVAAENHNNHPLTIYLAPLFAVFWRIERKGPAFSLSVSNLMKWCNLDTEGHKRTDGLKKLENELNYMVDRGYLGKWENLGYDRNRGKVLEAPLPSKCGEPLKCVLVFTPPEWLQEENKQIRARRDRLLAGAPADKPKEPGMTREEFIAALERSGLIQKDFANSLGVSQQMVAAIKKGTRKISPGMAGKVREKFGPKP